MGKSLRVLDAHCVSRRARIRQHHRALARYRVTMAATIGTAGVVSTAGFVFTEHGQTITAGSTLATIMVASMLRDLGRKRRRWLAEDRAELHDAIVRVRIKRANIADQAAKHAAAEARRARGAAIHAQNHRIAAQKRQLRLNNAEWEQVRGCQSKKRHNTQRKAIIHKDRILRTGRDTAKPGFKLGVYPCLFCGGWHVGHERIDGKKVA